MEETGWSNFTVRIPIKASIDALYMAWATRQGIENWFLRLSEYKSADGALRAPDEEVSKGDTYAWRWHGWPDDVEERGRILECNGRNLFKFSFGVAGNCTVNITQEDGLSIVALTQTEIPTDEHGKQYWHVGCKTGWTFYLTNMKSLFEGGLDLRNRNLELKPVINS